MSGAKQVADDRTMELVDQVLAAAPDAMVILNGDGRMVRVNKLAEKLCGYREEELLGQKLDFLMPKPRGARNVKRRPGQAGRRKVHPFSQGLESLVHHRDGAEFPVIVNLGLIEAGTDTLISAAIQKVQRDRSVEYLRTLVEASDDAIIELDKDDTIKSWNKGAEKIYGYKAEEILGQPVSELAHPAHRNEFSENLTRLRRGEHSLRLETERIHEDGHPGDVSLTISPVKSRGGAVVGALMVARDVTDYTEAQGAILSLRAIVDASDDAIIGKTIDGTIVSWNKGAEKIYGYKAQEILGRSISVLIPPGYPNELPQIMARLQRGEHIQKYETTRIHKDGHPIDVSVTISPITRKGGIVVGASVVARDITEHREAQNTILGLRAIVEASDDAIIGKTTDGTIISWNKGAEKIYGYSAEEILGQSISMLIPPGHGGELPGIMTRLQRGERIERYEAKRIRKDGRIIDVSISTSPVKRSDGIVVGSSVVARDITLQKEADETLRLSEERFRVALKNAPVAVFSQDLQLRYTWVNSSSLGLAREDYLGRTDAEIFGDDDGARLTAIKQEVLRTRIESRAEVTVRLKGEKRYFDIAVEPLRDPDEQVIGVLCSAVDITSLKETIVKLQRALDEVQALKGLVPICASCKKIRDERGTWEILEAYIQAHSGAKFSHGICPECMRKLYPEYLQ
jgi:PAS domain S-box-containing protein